MDSTALGVKNLFGSVSVSELVVNDQVTLNGNFVQSGEGSSQVNSLVPQHTDAVDIGSSTLRFKRAYLDDMDVGISRPHKYLKTNESGVVEYVDLVIHDSVTLGTANGLSLSGTGGQVLNLETATTSTNGAMSSTDKTKLEHIEVTSASGVTSTDIDSAVFVDVAAGSSYPKIRLEASTIDIGANTGVATNTINIGTGSGPTTLNLGATGDTVNIQGTLVTVDTTNAQVTDSVLTLNKNGVNANSVGLQIMGADPAVAAEVKTNGTGTTLQIQGVTGVNQVEIGGVLNVDQSAQTVSVNHNSNAASTDLRIKNANTGNAAGSVLELSVNNDAATITKYGAAHATNSNLLSVVNGSGTLNMDITGVTSGTCDLVLSKHNPVFLSNGGVPVASVNGLSLISGQELTMNVVTNGAAGAMTSALKTKLDDIPANSSVPTNLAYQLDRPMISRGANAAPSGKAFEVQTSTGTSILNIANNGTTTGTCDLVTSKHSAVTIGTANGLSLSGQQLSLATATTSSAGALSAADKVKIDGLTTSRQLISRVAFSTLSHNANGVLAGTIPLSNQYIDYEINLRFRGLCLTGPGISVYMRPVFSSTTGRCMTSLMGGYDAIAFNHSDDKPNASSVLQGIAEYAMSDHFWHSIKLNIPHVAYSSIGGSTLNSFHVFGVGNVTFANPPYCIKTFSNGTYQAGNYLNEMTGLQVYVYSFDGSNILSTTIGYEVTGIKV